MSGGSFDYLCYTDILSIWGRLSDLESMQIFCAEIGEQEASEKLAAIHSRLEIMKVEAELLLETHHELMKAVEWFASSDRPQSTIQETLKEMKTKPS